MIEALSDYRLPPSIHDLFVNDAHRRFFQRLQRFYFPEEAGGNRNCNHYEINASSPSYLITAGSKPCGYAIFPGLSQFFKPSTQFQQIGVAVPTSFIPTGSAAGVATPNARDVVQLSSFSDEAKGTYRPNEDLPWPPVAITRNAVANYCVAPDFACGHRLYLPAWVESSLSAPVEGFRFANRQAPGEGVLQTARPGFYLAFYEQNGFAVLEAHDTWLHPEVSFEQFKARVVQANRGLRLASNQEQLYTTLNGNRVRFVIWTNGEREDATNGAMVLGIDYGSADPTDRIGDAGNVTNRTLNGSVLNSPAEAVVEIGNPFLGTTLRLDLSNQWHPGAPPRRATSRRPAGVTRCGSTSTGAAPLKATSTGLSAHSRTPPQRWADAGVIRIAPGSTRGPLTLAGSKRFRLVAPIGGVSIGRP